MSDDCLVEQNTAAVAASLIVNGSHWYLYDYLYFANQKAADNIHTQIKADRIQTVCIFAFVAVNFSAPVFY